MQLTMKNILSFVCGAFLLAFAVSCDTKKDGISAEMVTNSASADGTADVPVSEIKFEKDTFNFGEVLEGEKVSHSFVFTNTGDNDLLISNARGSCGCTVPEWPKEPIAPGKSGKIDVVFNSEGKPGNAIKSVTVNTNTEPATHQLFITGFVKKAEEK
jgi:hypothetical protein